MVENDLGNNQLIFNSSIDAAYDDYSLITQERTQQQDLLLHLLANSQQALVVCGPRDIGKTRLLKNVQEQQTGLYFFCQIQSNLELNMDNLLESISQTIKQTSNNKHYQSLNNALDEVASRGTKLVLMLDDAGDLIPGLANEIIHFAAENPVLRVVFALDHDDLYIKNASDNLIDDCYLIELPPLTQNQCGDFLRYLSTKPWIHLSGNEINERLIATIYQQTHGIPGKIIAKLPTVAGHKRLDNSLWLLVAAVIVLVVAALALQWFSQQRNSLKIALPIHLIEQQQVASSPPKTQQQPAQEPAVASPPAPNNE